MILICPYLQKLHLIALFNIQANISQFMFYCLIKYRSSVLRWEYQVIHQYCNIVASVNIIAHSPIFAASCGEYNPQRLKQTEDEYSLKQ